MWTVNEVVETSIASTCLSLACLNLNIDELQNKLLIFESTYISYQETRQTLLPRHTRDVKGVGLWEEKARNHLRDINAKCR
jgi:hypothetical protein